MRKLDNAELPRKTIQEFHEAEKLPVILMLDNVRSALNVGSIFRTADAFLIQGIVLCGYTATPPHRDLLKTALGATETVTWQHYQNTREAVEQFKREGWKILAIEQTENSIPLNRFLPDANDKLVLIFGNEVDGVQQEVVSACHGSIEIPQQGMKHSLNIAVCAGIVVWEISRQPMKKIHHEN